MKILKVTYQKTYNIGPYLTDRVGFEAEPEGNPGDAPMDMLTMLEEIADEWHRKAHPLLYLDMGFPDGSPNNQTSFSAPTAIPTIDRSSEAKLEIAIDNAQTLEELKAIKQSNPVMKHPIMVLYNEKLKTLQSL